jgi:hypothetical protein
LPLPLCGGVCVNADAATLLGVDPTLVSPAAKSLNQPIIWHLYQAFAFYEPKIRNFKNVRLCMDQIQD